MTDVVLLEAALFQLRAASGEIDPELAPQLGLCISVLANSVAAGRGGVNASIVNDIEFAMNDLLAAIDDLPQAEVDRLAPLLSTLRREVESLKAATSLDPAVIEQIRAFQSKLRARMKAIERQTYVEGGDSSPLPHSPETFRDDAIPLGRQLVAAGFNTPALNALIAEPESLRFYSIREILDELDVIAG
jgi:hypothetical protein